MFETNFEIKELRLPPYFEWETKTACGGPSTCLEIHPKYTSVYCSKAMLDGWKLELLKFFSIQENRLKTPKLGFFK